jgi:hypothetical protein
MVTYCTVPRDGGRYARTGSIISKQPQLNGTAALALPRSLASSLPLTVSAPLRSESQARQRKNGIE